jgi:C-terminal processing protease CtpA/Prc
VPALHPRLCLAFLLAACSTALPDQRPPLADLEEPLDLRAEPDDEAARAALPAGSFSGLRVDDARDSLAAKLDQDGALRIAAIVENSPAAAAGLQVDDLLLEVKVADGAPRALRRPSEWRQLELELGAGTRVQLVVDRAGREAMTELVLVPRTRPAPRDSGERFREEDRVGVVLRTATEVEARAAGLGPGAGAVVVGLSKSSPWRAPGLHFLDLIAAVDGAPLAHPQDLLQRLRDPACERVRLRIRRGGEWLELDAPLSTRAHTMREISLPLLFDYEADRGHSEWSLLLGIFHYRSTAAAWRFRLLWLIGFGGGDADRLVEVDG